MCIHVHVFICKQPCAFIYVETRGQYQAVFFYHSTCFCYYYCLLSSEAEPLIFTWSSSIWLVWTSNESQIYTLQLLQCYNYGFTLTLPHPLDFIWVLSSPPSSICHYIHFPGTYNPSPFFYFSTTKNLKQWGWMGIPKWANFPFFEARKTDVCASVKSNCRAVMDTGRTTIPLRTRQNQRFMARHTQANFWASYNSLITCSSLEGSCTHPSSSLSSGLGGLILWPPHALWAVATTCIPVMATQPQ